jgi:sugar lactone lactonase YvrE
MPKFSGFAAILFGFATISVVSAQTSAWNIDTFAGTDRPVKDGGPGVSSLVNSPGGVVLDSAGDVIFADTNNHRVRKLTPAGIISTIVGTGAPGNSGDSGPALTAQLSAPVGLAIDLNGNLYIADYGANVVRMANTSGIITTVAGTGAFGNTGNGGKATSATLSGPYALALDKAGTLYIADEFNSAVRKVTPDGTIFAFVTQVSYPEGLAVDASGTVYVASWGDNKI